MVAIRTVVSWVMLNYSLLAASGESTLPSAAVILIELTIVKPYQLN